MSRTRSSEVRRLGVSENRILMKLRRGLREPVMSIALYSCRHAAWRSIPLLLTESSRAPFSTTTSRDGIRRLSAYVLTHVQVLVATTHNEFEPNIEAREGGIR